MIWAWSGFLAFIAVVLALDLGVFNRKSHAPTLREAMIFTTGTVVMAGLFAVLVYYAYEAHWLGLGQAIDAVDGQVNGGRLASVKFLTGYVVELSLSMDNVFVIALIFEHLKVPLMYQHRVLFWGILGALAMRGTMIGVGAQLVARYHWILLFFGAFLVFTGVKMMGGEGGPVEPHERWVIRQFRKRFPVTGGFHGHAFFVRHEGRLHATPLFICLLFLEMTDILFAVDSVPAIFGLTREPFVVFTSNIFAILGLRNLYFLLAGAVDKFHFLKYGLGVVLVFVGLKMTVLNRLWHGHFPITWSLGIIVGVIAVSIALSLLFPKQAQEVS